MSIAALRPRTTNPEFGAQTHSMRQEYQRRLGNITESAQQLAHAADLIAKAAEEAMATGTGISVQPQLNFITGALMRLAKDCGVGEHLQKGLSLQHRRLPVK